MYALQRTEELIGDGGHRFPRLNYPFEQVGDFDGYNSTLPYSTIFHILRQDLTNNLFTWMQFIL